MRLAAASQMKTIEETMARELKFPALLMMENAGRGLAEEARRMIDAGGRVLVVCGGGNNGGDGFAAARHLHCAGVSVSVACVCDADRIKGDAREMYETLLLMRIDVCVLPHENIFNGLAEMIEQADLVIDAIFGTGLRGAMHGAAALAAAAINAGTPAVISADIPSGVCANSGAVNGAAVRADATVTFGLPKPGLYLYPGAEYAGKIILTDIGVPAAEYAKNICGGEEFYVLEEREAKMLLPKRPPRANKGTFGRVLLLAGCDEMPGAAGLAANAAYRAGAGYVRALVTQSVADFIRRSSPETVAGALKKPSVHYTEGHIDEITSEIKKAGVIILGPGIGRSEETLKFAREVLLRANAPVVLDADGLYAAAGTDVLKRMTAFCVVTPHPGEMAALTGMSVAEITNDLVTAAREFSKKNNVITLLKDARSV
ncbi:MAG: NAD(P)H-hydrate epimerase, partial [Defluviitaleaceae bacterium]|nr:NAD(P)H-hydrate epimerase [Defluviitaleaceae bacterium]